MKQKFDWKRNCSSLPSTNLRSHSVSWDEEGGPFEPPSEALWSGLLYACSLWHFVAVERWYRFFRVLQIRDQIVRSTTREALYAGYFMIVLSNSANSTLHSAAAQPLSCPAYFPGEFVNARAGAQHWCGTAEKDPRIEFP